MIETKYSSFYRTGIKADNVERSVAKVDFVLFAKYWKYNALYSRLLCPCRKIRVAQKVMTVRVSKILQRIDIYFTIELRN